VIMGVRRNLTKREQIKTVMNLMKVLGQAKGFAQS